jgi:hypothetical protein
MGFTSMARYLTGITDEYRQTIRDQILNASEKDFNASGEILAEVSKTGRIVIMGSKERLEEANRKQGSNWIDLQTIL